MYKPENNNGRWWLVPIMKPCGEFDTTEAYEKDCEQRKGAFQILPEHAPIFQSMEKIEDGDFEVVEMPIEKDDLLPEHCQPKVARTKPHAIPKAKNEDVWEEVEKQVGGLKVSPNTRYVIRCLVQLWRDNYNLTRKK